MKNFKKTFLRAFFLVEAIMFTGMYFFGAQGLKTLNQLHDAQDKVDSDIHQLTREVTTLESEIVAWNNNAFFKEKVARESLHMARNNETIYLIEKGV